MFCQRQSNILKNKVHERAFRLMKVLLEKQKEFLIHQRNLQVLMTEIYKILNDIAPPLMKSLFQLRRNFQELSTEKRNTVSYGLETLTYMAPALWAKLPPKYVGCNFIR